MEITWLEQAGFLFQSEGLKIIIDSYLSDSVVSIVPEIFKKIELNSI